MLRTVRGLILPCALAVLLTATAGPCMAQAVFIPPPHVTEAVAPVAYYPPATSYYYTPPAVSYYTPPAVSYYAAPAVSYYTPPAVSYYTPPAVSYYAAPVATSYYAAPAVSYYAAPAAYPVQTVTTRYGLLGRPRVTVAQYYAP